MKNVTCDDKFYRYYDGLIHEWLQSCLKCNTVYNIGNSKIMTECSECKKEKLK